MGFEWYLKISCMLKSLGKNKKNIDLIETVNYL
jgi:hypothetical protein